METQMGGDDASSCSSSRSEISKEKCRCVNKCQICGYDSHLAPTCPFLYTVCKTPKCSGIRKLMVSGTANNPGRIFLKCQHVKCGSFQWLDVAVSESLGAVGNSSVQRQHRELGCFAYGEKNHFKIKCPWEGSPCRKEGCHGVREVRTSSLTGYEGQKNLRCTTCNDSMLLDDAVKGKAVTNSASLRGARILIDTTLEEFCAKFQTKTKFEKKRIDIM